MAEQTQCFPSTMPSTPVLPNPPLGSLELPMGGDPEVLALPTDSHVTLAILLLLDLVFLIFTRKVRGL